MLENVFTACPVSFFSLFLLTNVCNLLSRKEQIAVTAQTLFREKGYAATSMRDLATEVGIEAASLYNHFPSKEKILQEICFRMAEEFNHSLQITDDSSKDAIQWLDKAIAIHTQLVLENKEAAGVFFEEWKHLSEPYKSDFEKMRKSYENKFVEKILEGQQAGLFRPCKARLFVLNLFGTMNHIYQWYDPSGQLPPAQIATEISQLFLTGLCCGSPPNNHKKKA